MPLIQLDDGSLLTDGESSLASDKKCCECDCKFYFYQKHGSTMSRVTMLKPGCSGTYAGTGPDTPVYVKRGEWSPQFIAAGYWDGLGNHTAFTGWYKNGTEKITSGYGWFASCDTVVSGTGGDYAITTDKTLADNVPPMPNYNSHPIVWAPNRLSVYCPEDGSLTTAKFEARIEDIYCIIKFTSEEGGTVTNGNKELHAPPAQTSTATANEGYKFIGWSSSGTDGENNPDFSKQATVTVGCRSLVTRDESIRNNGPVTRTVTAKFSKECGKVTFTYGSNGYVTVAGTVQVGENSPAESIGIPHDGYAFEGWYKDNVRVSRASKYTVSCDDIEPGEHITVTAKFTKGCKLYVQQTYFDGCPASVTVNGMSASPYGMSVPCGQDLNLHGKASKCTSGGDDGGVWKSQMTEWTATGTDVTFPMPDLPAVTVTFNTTSFCNCPEVTPGGGYSYIGNVDIGRPCGNYTKKSWWIGGIGKGKVCSNAVTCRDGKLAWKYANNRCKDSPCEKNCGKNGMWMGCWKNYYGIRLSGPAKANEGDPLTVCNEY